VVGITSLFHSLTRCSPVRRVNECKRLFTSVNFRFARHTGENPDAYRPARAGLMNYVPLAVYL
jgi:hypothetical protein